MPSFGNKTLSEQAFGWKTQFVPDYHQAVIGQSLSIVDMYIYLKHLLEREDIYSSIGCPSIHLSVGLCVLSTSLPVWSLSLCTSSCFVCPPASLVQLADALTEVHAITTPMWSRVLVPRVRPKSSVDKDFIISHQPGERAVLDV